jgi:hypothetical protein
MRERERETKREKKEREIDNAQYFRSFFLEKIIEISYKMSELYILKLPGTQICQCGNHLTAFLSAYG